MRYIHYILLGNKTQSYQIKGENHCITVNVFTKEDLETFPGWCGARQHEVYCDAALNTRHYKSFINNIVKPELCFRYSNSNIIFI